MKKTDKFYRSREWEALRVTALRRDNYKCQKCGELCLGKKRKKPSPHVDHILPISERPDLKYSIDNLRVLCGPCHSRITIMSMHGRAKEEIGLDGYPK